MADAQADERKGKAVRAIIADPAGPRLADVPRPSPNDGEVLVRVRAAALNRIDLGMSRGGTHGGVGQAGLPFGMEWAGEVAEVGPGVEKWTVGDRVMGVGPHAFAEYKVARVDTVFPVWEELTFEEAATLPTGLQTMHDALTVRGAFAPGQTVLIQGASSAMGLIGMQIAKELGASLVIGTSTSDERRSRLSEFSADAALDSRSGDWVGQVQELTEGRGVDVLLDLVAGPLVNDGMRALRIGGRMVNIGRVGGESGEFDFDLHSMRRITYVGTTFRTRPAVETAEVAAAARQALGPALREGRIRMPIERIYQFEDALSAFTQMAENKHFGKIVISMSPEARAVSPSNTELERGDMAGGAAR